MQDLPTFSTSVIQLELKQTEYEILFVALKAFEHLKNLGTSDDAFKVLMVDAQRDNGFKLPSEILNNVEILQTSYGKLMDLVMDSYMDHRGKYIDQLNQELHDYAQENFEPDILCLEDGQTLRVEL